MVVWQSIIGKSRSNTRYIIKAQQKKNVSENLFLLTIRVCKSAALREKKTNFNVFESVMSAFADNQRTFWKKKILNVDTRVYLDEYLRR